MSGATMARVLFVVARGAAELLEFLRQDFAAELAEGVIEIFMDRRRGPGEPGVAPGESEARRRDRRRNREVSRELRELGCAVVRQEATTPLE